jgi:hypothetical protein
MILESNLLAKLQVGEKMLSHGLNTLISVFVRQISLAFDSD